MSTVSQVVLFAGGYHAYLPQELLCLAHGMVVVLDQYDWVTANMSIVSGVITAGVGCIWYCAQVQLLLAAAQSG